MTIDLSKLINRVHHIEALKLLQSLPDACADAIITDPPYSSGGAFRGDRMTSTNVKYMNTGTENLREDFAGDNRDQRSFVIWCSIWIGEALRVLKPGGVFVLFTDWRQLPSLTDALQCGGAVWRGIAVWDKTEGARPTLGRFTNQAEYIVWGSAGAMPFERLDGNDKRTLPGVFRTVVKQADKHHVTGKPTDLMRNLVRIVPKGGLIIDPFAGSGTTLVAAQLEGYDFIGGELLPHYVQVCNQRLGVDLSGAGPLF